MSWLPANNISAPTHTAVILILNVNVLRFSIVYIRLLLCIRTHMKMFGKSEIQLVIF
jgi:hypothetical protein